MQDEEWEALQDARPEWARNLTGHFCYLLLVSTIGPLLFGYHLAELNAPQDVITCQKTTFSLKAFEDPLPRCIPMKELEIGLVTSMFTLGGLLGALSAGYFAVKYGRLQTMRGNTIFFILGPLAESLALDVPIMVVGRFVSGIGAGAAVVVVPLYISEIAPPKQKGFFGSFTQVMTCFGIVLTQVLGLFLSRSNLWRAILGVGGIIGLIQFAGLVFATESPKWTAEQGDASVAKAQLQRIRGKDYDLKEEVEGWKLSCSEHRTGEESALLEEETADSSEPTTPRNDDSEGGTRQKIKKDIISVLQVLLKPEYNRATIVVMIIMVAQQLCGINSIVFYGVTLLADLLGASSAIINVLVSVFNLVVTAACAPLIDKLGRRRCLILSMCGMATSSLLLGIGILGGIPILSTLAVFGYVGAFGLGLGPVPFILSSELVGAEAVGATQSWALAANWLATFLVAQFFPILNKALGMGKVYFIFAAIAVLSAIFTYRFVPETEGKRDGDEVWQSVDQGDHHQD